ncbi:MAG: Crp/Fnr family transcriptional regulator [Bacillota bacterium]
MQALENTLAHVPVFRKLSIAKLQEIDRIGVQRYLEPGEFIVSAGEIWKGVVYIREGLIEGRKESAEGRALVVNMFGAGDVIWGHTLFDGEPAPNALIVKTPTLVMQWHGAELLPLISNNSEALWDLCIMLNKKLRRASNVIEEMAFSPNAGRLAKLLLDFFETRGEDLVRRTMTLDEMAAAIGTTREVVCRLLYRFSDTEIIQVNRTHIKLINKNKLLSVASGC